jgi:outer membrane murein-binding lipoprotein Lpp
MPTSNKLAPLPNTAHASEIADYIRAIAADLEKLSQEAGLDAVAACLRAAITEARRAKSEDYMVKLGLKPDRRVV